MLPGYSVFSERMEQEEDYEEADDFEEEQDGCTSKGLSVSNILRGEYVDEEDYDEEYD